MTASLQEASAKIAELAQMLTTAHPRMPLLLKEIHDHLRRDPDVVTLLPEEDIQVIVNGLKKQTQVDLVTTAAKSGSRNKSLKNITTDDL